MRILVDGMDLTGKTTLCATLVSLFRARGVCAAHVTGSLHRGLLSRLAAERYRRTRTPGDALQSWLFALASFADAIATRDRRVVVQEAGVEHTLALAEAFDRPLPAAIARSAARLQPPADLAVLLTAPRRVRLARLASRGHADPIDRLLLEDPVKAEIAELSLHAALRRRHPHLLVMDSSQLDPESILRRTISYLDHTQRIQTVTGPAVLPAPKSSTISQAVVALPLVFTQRTESVSPIPKRSAAVRQAEGTHEPAESGSR